MSNLLTVRLILSATNFTLCHRFETPCQFFVLENSPRLIAALADVSSIKVMPTKIPFPALNRQHWVVNVSFP